MDPAEAILIREHSGSVVVVPCVKELAKQPLKEVPERYLRTDLDLLHVAPNTNSSSSLQVPVIDMSKLLSPEFHASELQNFDYACKEWGFFQLINHGVEVSLLENVKNGVTELFNLPMEEKNKFSKNAEDGQGFGQQFVVSEEQKLEWADLFALVTLPQQARTPRLFPNLPLPFRDNLNAYCIELRKLAIKMIELVGEALKIEPNEMRELGEEGWQSMRMNYYPPCPQADKVIGLNPHSDVSILTILLQVNEMEGLQIKKHGKWVPISPLLNAFVINIGDSLEIVTNGIYRSIEHRATVNKEKERISVATFYSPKMQGNIGPSPSLVTPQTPPLFKTIRVSEFRQHFFSRQLNGKSQLDFVRIQNEDQQIKHIQ